MAGMRVLIAYEERHRVYGGALENLLRTQRPHVSVKNVPPDEIEDQLERFDPHLVLCSGSNTVDTGGRGAWIELSPEPDKTSRFCLGGRYTEASNPRLDALLEVVDEAEESVRSGADLGGC